MQIDPNLNKGIVFKRSLIFEAYDFKQQQNVQVIRQKSEVFELEVFWRRVGPRVYLYRNYFCTTEASKHGLKSKQSYEETDNV